jgi:hypothetical protein
MVQDTLRLGDIHIEDRTTPRDLRWRRDGRHQEIVQVREWDLGYPGSTGAWATVLGLEAGHRQWASCAGCGMVGELLVDPITPGLLWCGGCGGTGPR